MEIDAALLPGGRSTSGYGEPVWMFGGPPTRGGVAGLAASVPGLSVPGITDVFGHAYVKAPSPSRVMLTDDNPVMFISHGPNDVPPAYVKSDFSWGKTLLGILGAFGLAKLGGIL